MGTWNTGILENDSAMDVYGFFEKLYNKQALDIESIKAQTLTKFGLLNEHNDAVYGNEGWLAYALICWECKALDERTLQVVKEILKDRQSIAEEWEELAEARIQEIEKFLAKIATPAKRKKTIRKEYLVHVPFQEGDCLVVACEDGMYSAAILLDVSKKHADEPNMWTYFFGTTRIYSEKVPTFDEIVNSHFVVVNYGKTYENKDASWIKNPKLWITGSFIGTVKNEEQKAEIEARINSYQVVGRIQLASKPPYPLSYGFFWLDQSYQLRSQTEWEKEHPESVDLSYPVKQFIGGLPPDQKKKGWKFWK